MNKIKLYLTLFITTLSIFSCSNDDNNISIKPPRDYGVQYATDIKTIEDYLNENYFTVVDNPGQTNDQDITITKILPNGTEPSIMSYLNATSGPTLKTKTVERHNITYTLYYLILRPGTGDSPCNVDGVLTSYVGSYLPGDATTLITATEFEKVTYPQTFLSLYDAIKGWSETFPEFKTGGIPTTNGDGSNTYSDFGAGVMFVPSGLAYFNIGSKSIPAYSPLVFSFKLYEIQRLDQDNDGILSYQEDIDNDGYTRTTDDTDGDKIPNYLDIDDDGDNYTTKLEITKPNGSNPTDDGPSLYYPYDPFEDNPLTIAIEEPEKKGVPAYAATGEPDYTSPTRLRIHLDKDHHTAKP